MKMLKCLPLILCLTASAAQAANDDFAGVGVELSAEGKSIVVKRILPNTPAAAQKDLHAGDRIIAVAQGKEPAVQVQSLVQTARSIRGPKGTTVCLTIIPAGEDETQARVFSFVRGELKVPWGDGLLLANGTKAPESAEARRQIVSVDFIPKEPSLVISDQSSCITVQVPVLSRSQAPLGTVDHRPAPDVPKLGLQIWLLKADGTVVPQEDVDRGASFMGSMGAQQWFVMFYFAKVPPAQITGVVFLKEGKLYSRPIAATDWRPI